MQPSLAERAASRQPCRQRDLSVCRLQSCSMNRLQGATDVRQHKQATESLKPTALLEQLMLAAEAPMLDLAISYASAVLHGHC